MLVHTHSSRLSIKLLNQQQRCLVVPPTTQVFSLDFATTGASPTVRGSVAVPERFSRLTWGVKPSEQSNLPVSASQPRARGRIRLPGPPINCCGGFFSDPPGSCVLQYGIIAGGLSDGTICLWNPAPLIEGSGHNPLLSKLQKHQGAVSVVECLALLGAHQLQLNNAERAGTLTTLASADTQLCCFCTTQVKGLEFNSFSPNLLASGAADGELCIWDVAAPAQPSLYPALKVLYVCVLCAATCAAAKPTLCQAVGC